jgi:hypothetical protein
VVLINLYDSDSKLLNNVIILDLEYFI